MKKTVKTEVIVNMYPVLDGAALGKMEVADRFAFIKALRPMRRVAEEFRDFREDAVKRLAPEKYEEIAEKVNRFNAMSRDERNAALAEDAAMREALEANGEFNVNVDRCLREELDREVELEFEGLTEEAFGRLMESNPEWTAGVVMGVEDLMMINY